MAATSGQWSPLVAASFVVPRLYPLFILKPSLGLAGVAAFPSFRGVALAIAIVLLSIIV
jgi:hypothetical protein